MEKFVYGRRKIRFCSSVSGNEPQATKKFFGAAVFQKCCRGVGEQPTFAKQIKLHDEKKQKSKRESEESQLPSKSEGCNERYGFRGNCDSEGKLGMCPSLAEPNSGGIPMTSRRLIRIFLIQQFFKNAGEVWASSPHLRSKFDFATLFSCCNCIF